MERSDKLNRLVSEITTATFADPFPSEYASRDQLERLRDEINQLRIDISNMRHSLVGVLKDRFDALESGK